MPYIYYTTYVDLIGQYIGHPLKVQVLYAYWISLFGSYWILLVMFDMPQIHPSGFQEPFRIASRNVVSLVWREEIVIEATFASSTPCCRSPGEKLLRYHLDKG